MKQRLFLSIFALVALASCMQKYNNKKMQVSLVDTTPKATIVEENTPTWEIKYVGKYPVKVLEDSVAVEHYSFRYVCNVSYNGEEFPINMYATFESSGFGRMDSLAFVYDGVKQAVPLSAFSEHFYSDANLHLYDTLAVLQNDIIYINDYNFDSYLDISIDKSGGGKNYVLEVFLYDPRKKCYYRHAEVSEMGNLGIDKKTKTVLTSWTMGVGRNSFEKYKWKEEKLVPIYSEEEDYVDSLAKVHVRTTRTLQNDVWITQADTTWEDE